MFTRPEGRALCGRSEGGVWVPWGVDPRPPKKGITKEKATITNIIKEDILLTKEQEKQEQGQDVIIEWNDE